MLIPAFILNLETSTTPPPPPVPTVFRVNPLTAVSRIKDGINPLAAVSRPSSGVDPMKAVASL